MATALAPELPDPEPDLVRHCVDPGLPDSITTVEEATEALGEQRLYAACGTRKQRDWIEFYANVKRGLAVGL